MSTYIFMAMSLSVLIYGTCYLLHGLLKDSTPNFYSGIFCIIGGSLNLVVQLPIYIEEVIRRVGV